MSINLMPSSTDEEIAQNVRIISSTPRGSQPLDRDLGIQANLLDASGDRGQALLAAAIIDTLPQQEPRITVKGVTFTGDATSGEYTPAIDYEVKG